MGSCIESPQRIRELEERVRWTRKVLMGAGMVLIAAVAMNVTTIAANSLIESNLAHYGFGIVSYPILVHTNTVPPSNMTSTTFNITMFNDSERTVRDLWLNFTANGPSGVRFMLDGIANRTQTINGAAEWIVNGPITILPNQELAFVHLLSWTSTADFGAAGSYYVTASSAQQP